MKKKLSVFGLAARMSIYKVMVLLIVLAAAETLLFLRVDEKMDYIYFIEDAVKESYIFFAYIIGFVLLCLILMESPKFGKSHQEYSIHRFGLSPKDTVIWWGVYNASAIIIFNIFQLLIIMALCSWHMTNWNYSSGNQTMLLAFYRSAFLHELMPMDDWISWIKNIMVPAAAGIHIAYLGCIKRRDHGALIGLLLGFGYVFPSLAGNYTGNYSSLYAIAAIAISIVTLVFTIYDLCVREGKYYEK